MEYTLSSLQAVRKPNQVLSLLLGNYPFSRVVVCCACARKRRAQNNSSHMLECLKGTIIIEIKDRVPRASTLSRIKLLAQYKQCTIKLALRGERQDLIAVNFKPYSVAPRPFVRPKSRLATGNPVVN